MCLLMRLPGWVFNHNTQIRCLFLTYAQLMGLGILCTICHIWPSKTPEKKKVLQLCLVLFNFYWSIVDLQCSVSFRCIAKWISNSVFMILCKFLFYFASLLPPGYLGAPAIVSGLIKGKFATGCETLVLTCQPLVQIQDYINPFA